MNNNIIKILFFTIVFLTAISVWYSPVLFKGYAPYKISEQISLAKNLHNAGIYSVENEKNVYLASSIVKEQGHIAGTGNKFTAYLYSYLFKITGILNPGALVLFSIILNSISLLIFTLVVYKLFGLIPSALFSLFYIFIPYNWYQLYSIGTYEFAVFFFVFFLFVFFVGQE